METARIFQGFRILWAIVTDLEVLIHFIFLATYLDQNWRDSGWRKLSHHFSGCIYWLVFSCVHPLPIPNPFLNFLWYHLSKSAHSHRWNPHSTQTWKKAFSRYVGLQCTERVESTLVPLRTLADPIRWLSSFDWWSWIRVVPTADPRRPRNGPAE